ncbi:zinc finger protein 37-like [Uranotaenia lowii]|uniref:zinc finger protein 37-like n=1 Tax=Uranotaenia lowii TaxID=190385 RepID=UPI00247B1926|nr:zinc finger protein 37-like [Uranotaenia lowii]XP_055608685.1 zinc finger protein 37-like [Uranotaenia lowii]
MIYYCAVRGCRNKISVTKHDTTILYHKFPTNKQQWEAWRVFCDNGKEWTPAANQGICSEHFGSECYGYDAGFAFQSYPALAKQIRRLVSKAVPNLRAPEPQPRRSWSISPLPWDDPPPELKNDGQEAEEQKKALEEMFVPCKNLEDVEIKSESEDIGESGPKSTDNDESGTANIPLKSYCRLCLRLLKSDFLELFDEDEIKKAQNLFNYKYSDHHLICNNCSILMDITTDFIQAVHDANMLLEVSDVTLKSGFWEIQSNVAAVRKCKRMLVQHLVELGIAADTYRVLHNNDVHRLSGTSNLEGSSVGEPNAKIIFNSSSVGEPSETTALSSSSVEDPTETITSDGSYAYELSRLEYKDLLIEPIRIEALEMDDEDQQLEREGEDVQNTAEILKVESVVEIPFEHDVSDINESVTFALLAADKSTESTQHNKKDDQTKNNTNVISKRKRSKMTREEYLAHQRKNRKPLTYNETHWLCYLCGKTVHIMTKEYHINEHKGIKPYRCEKGCDKTFYGVLHKQRHEHRQHGGKDGGSKSMTCTVCGKVLRTNPYGMSLHMRIHASDKRFECEHCGKRFTIKTKLNEHMRIHLNVYPYECDQCGKKFKFKQGKDVHVKAIHEKHKM